MKNGERALISFFVIVVILGFMTLFVLGYNAEIERKNRDSSIDEHLTSIYDLLNRNSRTIIKCRDDYASLTHYISGHEYRHPINHCPECGLLQQLDMMEDFLDESCQKLAVVNDGLDKNSKEYKNNQEVIDKLTLEKLQIKKHLFSMDERAKEVNKIMRDHRITGNEKVEPN